MAYNRWYRITLIMIIAIASLTAVGTSAEFSLQSLSCSLQKYNPSTVAYTMLDSYCVKNFGGQDADNWISQKAFEFLGYFGVSDTTGIKIRKLEFSAQQASSNLAKLPAIALWTGLWFNPNLDNGDETLWHIAHESAHFALNHPAKSLLMIKARPLIVAGVVSALFLAGNTLLLTKTICPGGHLLKNVLTFLTQEMIIGLVGAPVILQAYVRMIAAGFNAEKEYEREADLAAVKMLCENGYAHVVEKHLDSLNKYIEQGVSLLHPYAHPSLIETRDYMQEFWSGWLAEHADYSDLPHNDREITGSPLK